MSSKKQQKCSKEFKAEAVKLVIEQGYSVSEAARNLGIAVSTLGRWKREAEKENNDGNVNSPSLQMEVRRLRTENKRLKMEREILKKAAAFFAKETE